MLAHVHAVSHFAPMKFDLQIALSLASLIT